MDIYTEKDRDEMLLKIMEVDFALLDLRLYLNTHPCCLEGLAHCQYFSQESKTLKEEYEKRYGPLSQSSAVSADYFEWVDAPWPWIRTAERAAAQGAAVQSEINQGAEGGTNQGGRG